jgi:DNA-directed RNA polymerase subunit M/transcription elongation factor TFIIS
MKDSDGDFKAPKPADDVKCRKCGLTGHVVYAVWESSCGGYEDYKFTCGLCGHHWWVDGIDS